MPSEYYPTNSYPKFPKGGAYMQSGNITHKLLKAVDEYSGYVLDIDDMFITGMMAEKAGVERHKTNLIADTGCKNASAIEERVVIFQCKDQGQIEQFWSDFKGNTSSNECLNYTIYARTTSAPSPASHLIPAIIFFVILIIGLAVIGLLIYCYSSKC